MMATGKRLVNSKSGLRKVCQNGRDDEAPWFLAEPPWTPDSEADCCMNCRGRFDFVRRRHHCRRCGHLFCAKCCGNKVHFHRMGFVDPVRLCAPCAEVTRREEHFFDNDLKILYAGAPFYVKRSINRKESPLSDDGVTSDLSDFYPAASKNNPMPSGSLYNCRLSPDQRVLLFEPHESNTSKPPSPSCWPITATRGSSAISPSMNLTHPVAANEMYETLCPNPASPIDLTKAIDIETFDSGKFGCGKITLCVKTSETEKLILNLESPPEPSRKPSVLWISALIQSLKMMFESRLQANQDLNDG